MDGYTHGGFSFRQSREGGSGNSIEWTGWQLSRRWYSSESGAVIAVVVEGLRGAARAEDESVTPDMGYGCAIFLGLCT